MSDMTIRNIDEATAVRLRERAARHGRPVEEEACHILRAALVADPEPPSHPGRAIRARFAALGGVELPAVPRDPIRDPVDAGA